MSGDARAALEDLWHAAGGDPAALARVILTGTNPPLPTDFKIGAAVATTSLAATEAWGLRTGRRQDAEIDARAPIAASCSERCLRVDGQPGCRRDPLWLSETPPFWAPPSVPLGPHEPAWPA
jgi:hypothetical protein